MVDQFPETLWVCKSKSRDLYVCTVSPDGINGLACFTRLEDLLDFVNDIDALPDPLAVQTTFDEAREIAKRRPAIVVALILDPPKDPLIHFIR